MRRSSEARRTVQLFDEGGTTRAKVRALGEAERANAYTRAYRLVPALRKDIEGDLPANRVSQIQVLELGAHLGHHRLTNLVRQVELLKVVTFFPVAVASDRGDVEHALPKLDKGPTLHGVSSVDR